MEMKSYSKAIAAILAIATLAVATVSCSRFGKSKGQSTEFAAFIKAYTGGIISDKSTIRVELATDIPDAVPGADIKDGILSFTPSIKGTTRWLSRSTIEFIPEPGALKNGQSYTGKLRLGKIEKIADRKFKVFTFKFMIALKEAVLSVNTATITSSSPESASVDGTVALTEELPLEKVREMVQFDFHDKSAELSVTPGADPYHFHFEIIGLSRDSRDRKVKVFMKPSDTGFVTDSKVEAVVPGKGAFKVLQAENNEGEEPFIDICFTEPLADVDDNSGLFTLTGAGQTYVQAEDNHVRVFYENAGEDPLQLTVSGAVKSFEGVRLDADFTKRFASSQGKPAVEIPLTGTILPNAKELILPFRAVNLKAVDISVIQIYEENVLMFLQDNDLGGSNSLRRSGRLVYKRCIPLDSDPSRNLHRWQDFSADLSGLFKQEAGAIYRIRLSFKQEYSIYGSNDEFRSGIPSGKMVEISSENVTAEDDDTWDSPYPYFYENYIDWDKYVWEDRDNPAKPTYYMEEDRFPAVNLLTSNLGVIAKYSGEDKIWVSVSDILSTEPVFNAELYVYSYQLKEIGYAKTGTDGMAEISISAKPFVVVAKRGGATSYLKVTEGNEKQLSRFDVGGKVLDKGLKAFIYGERGVWRPGDTLHVTMILEDRDDKLPSTHPAVMELYAPDGSFYSKMVNGSGKNGFYVFSIQTKASDPTGSWNAYFKIGGATFHKSLRIEDVKPNRLKISNSLTQESVSAGATVPVTIKSSWLTGPPASGLTAKAAMTLRRGPGTFKGFEGYNFVNPLSHFDKSEHEILSTRLDKEGAATTKVTMPSATDAPGMLLADIVTSVEEQGGDLSFNTVTVPYSPYRSYVGLKIPVQEGGSFLETDKDYSFPVAVVDKEGKRVSGDEIVYAVYKLKWSWWWESRSEDLDSYVNSTAATPVAKGSFMSGSADGAIPFRVDYPEWGRYLVLAQDVTSGHVAGQVVFADWPATRGRSSKSDPDALTMLSFSTDRKSYDVGDKATVYIPSASKGHALVSIENSRRVLSRQWVKVTGEGDATCTFKVTPQMAPGFYIHVSLIQPHERTDNDLPIRLYGVQPVLVNDKDSHLNPVITMPDVLEPEEDFTVKVSEKDGKEMTYTLAVVDEGLLDLTGYKTPDPWKSMYEREALGVKTWDLYDDVVGAFSGRFSPMFSIGGDETVMLGAKKDNRFNPVVKFIGPFTLQRGSASHKLKLPMYVGSVRVMVVAACDNAYGNAEKTVQVKSPLMVLPTLPRVIGAGEKVSLPVNVFALDNAVKEATVSVSVEGPLAVSGSTQSKVSFPVPGDTMVSFGLEATGTGPARVTVTASGAGHKATQTISMEVRNSNPATTTVTKVTVPPGETRHLGFTPFTPGEDQWAELELASFPAIDYNGLYTFVKGYGYNCTEQIAARGIILLSIKDMLDEEKKAEAERMIPGLVQQACQRQLSNGGFAYWPGSADASSWVSSMTGEFLVMASRNGFQVSKGVLASWSRFQKKAVQEYRNTGGKYLHDLDQAYRLYVLALNSEPENGAMNRLRESENLSLQASWMLASAYSVAGKKNIAKELVQSLRTDFTATTEADCTFGSPLRDKALAVESLAWADMLTEAVESALDVSKAVGSGWYSTQEAAFSAKALAIVAAKSGSGTIDAQVTQGGNMEPVKSAKPVSLVKVDTGAGGIDLKNDSKASLYATLVTSTVAAAGEKTLAKANGLGLNVAYTTLDGKVLNPTEMVQGTDFTATITVSNTSGVRDYTNLALEEMVPSGWEIFNDRLHGEGGNGGQYTYRDIRDDRIIWSFDLPKGTSRTFKVKLHAAYEGEFILPAVKCEAMYDSRISACTSSGTAKVTK